MDKKSDPGMANACKLKREKWMTQIVFLIKYQDYVGNLQDIYYHNS